VHLIGVPLIGVPLIGVPLIDECLMGVHLTECASHGRISHVCNTNCVRAQVHLAILSLALFVLMIRHMVEQSLAKEDSRWTE
jgi:hypothetical protein